MQASQSLPLYVQISEMLIRDVLAGRLQPGDRLPPERQMAVDLGISIGTLRKSLADLAEKDVLERRQGSGNYIKSGQTKDAVYSFFRLELVTGGGLPTAQVLSVDSLEKPKYLPDFGDGPKAYRIRRLRSLGEQVAALEEIWLDGCRSQSLEPGDLLESLYLYYRENLGFWVQRIEDRIGLGDAPGWSDQFSGKMGLVDRVSWDQTGKTVEVSRTWFDPVNVRYVSRLV